VAVVCHISEILLTTLADRAELAGSAEAAGLACVRWREVMAAWTDMTTGLGGLRAPGIADTGDLVVRLGRLAFADPGWTPVRSRGAPVRAAGELAPDGRQAAVVAGAVHHAAEALACVAAADSRAMRAVVRAGRIYVPTRTLPDRLDVPHRLWSPRQGAVPVVPRSPAPRNTRGPPTGTTARTQSGLESGPCRAPGEQEVPGTWLAAEPAG
jgi:hypothetical protein